MSAQIKQIDPGAASDKQDRESFVEAVKRSGLQLAPAMVAFVQGRIPCNHCNDNGKVTLVQLMLYTGEPAPAIAAVEDSEHGKKPVTCPFCWGRKYEIPPVQHRLRALTQLVSKCVASPKSVDISRSLADLEPVFALYQNLLPEDQAAFDAAVEEFAGMQD